MVKLAAGAHSMAHRKCKLVQIMPAGMILRGRALDRQDTICLDIHTVAVCTTNLHAVLSRGGLIIDSGACVDSPASKQALQGAPGLLLP